jgi:hypothetical protein
MPSQKRAGWVTYRGDVGDAGPPDPARSRKDRAASLRPEFPRFELLRLLAFSAQRTGIRGAGMSARESQTLVNFGPALARRLPANTLRPKTARRAGHLRHPLALKEPPQQ